MPERFDVAVIGGGPGGYVAAIRAAQLGARTAIVEKDRLGGTCLVRGCIPTKAMLQSSELYAEMRRGSEFGVIADHLRFDYPAAARRRDQVVDQLVNGVGTLMRANGITVLRGTGRLLGRGRFQVGDDRYEARHIVVATGSVPSRLNIKGVEHTIDSDAILGLRELPFSMAVIGGGVVGMEWGACFAALGCKVTVLELLPQILPMVEEDMVLLYRRHFERLGGEVQTGAHVQEVARTADGLEVRYRVDDGERSVRAQVVLLATGRRPYTEGLGLEEVGVRMERGRVVVDDHLRTSVEGIWAIGDVIGGIMLAHVASYEGVCAVENICGFADRVPDYHAAPNCIYTDPEIATVGLGEREARERGIEVKVGRFPFAALGRALTLGRTEGAVKVIAGADDTLLGVEMVGPRVTDLIAEATLAVQQRLKLHDLELTMHAHPTLPESMLEAALAADGRAIHIQNRRSRGVPTTAGPAPASASTASQEESHVARSAQDQTTSAALPPPEPPALTVEAERLGLKKENREQLLELYRLMLLIRRFEERAQVEYTKAKIGGYCHLNLGEEATVVGGILALRPGDYIYTSYREHGHAIARGVDPKAVMAELFGRETGVAHGRGGSMHIFDARHRFMGGYGIVGGHLPLAVGAAFAIKYQHAFPEAARAAAGAASDDIVFCMFGDGATNIGAFHESLNFAKVLQVPVVWFCINNQYGMGTSVERASAVTELYRKACAYDMEAIRIDGMDVLEVLHRTAEVVEKTRRDSQPRFIEAVNYRFRGHSVVDPDRYRSDEEKERWRQSDPVLGFQHRLEEARIASREELERIEESVEAEIEDIVRYADQSPNPPVDELYRYLYAGEWEVEHA